MRPIALIFAFVLLMSSAAAPTVAHDGENHEGNKEEQGWPGSARAQEVARALLADSQPAADLAAQSATTCTNGFAGEYPCSNIDLLSFLPLADIGGGKGNDIWGWTDSGREYAIMGRTTGTAFVDITVPESPVYLGNLPTTRFSSTWRDIKVYENHAFIVSESRNHGMQVFDLTRLRGLTAPVTFSADALYTGFATAHNIAINEESGFAYAIGTNTCSGGLHMVNISTPKSPIQAGCFSADGYTHDVQCVNYAGPDTTRTGRELCFASNEDTLTIVDVTDKAAPFQLDRETYVGASYTHQGWLTDDQRYFLIDDEADEGKGFNTRTYVFDVANPADLKHIGTHEGTNPAIDHNQYIVGNHSYQANYRSGLRILDISGVATPALSEVAFFDIYPADDQPEFNGAWSVYPFFGSGTVVVSGIEQGLYVLRPNLGPSNNTAPLVALDSPAEGATVSGEVPIQITASDTEDTAGSLVVEWRVDSGDWMVAEYNSGNGKYEANWTSTGVTDGPHSVTARATDSGNLSASDPNAVTVDNINEAPTGLTATPGDTQVFLDWSDNTDTDVVGYNVYRDSGSGYTMISSVTTSDYADADLTNGQQYCYQVTAVASSGNESLPSSQACATPTASAAATTVHVADLDGAANLKGKSGRWEALVTVTIRDDTGAAVEGATVTGDWTDAASGRDSGTTGSDGTVTLSSGNLTGGTQATFTVTGVSADGLTYVDADNTDPELDSDGTTITIVKS